MEVTIFFARFWGSLFIILGILSLGANFLGRTIKISEDKAVTVSTGYITMLLGLVTVILHNIWVLDWRLIITLLGWTTLLKGMMKMGFPAHVSKKAQMFKKGVWIWSAIIFLFGAWLFWMSL